MIKYNINKWLFIHWEKVSFSLTGSSRYMYYVIICKKPTLQCFGCWYYLHRRRSETRLFFDCTYEENCQKSTMPTKIDVWFFSLLLLSSPVVHQYKRTKKNCAKAINKQMIFLTKTVQFLRSIQPPMAKRDSSHKECDKLNRSSN